MTNVMIMLYIKAYFTLRLITAAVVTIMLRFLKLLFSKNKVRIITIISESRCKSSKICQNDNEKFVSKENLNIKNLLMGNGPTGRRHQCRMPCLPKILTALGRYKRKHLENIGHEQQRLISHIYNLRHPLFIIAFVFIINELYCYLK